MKAREINILSNIILLVTKIQYAFSANKLHSGIYSYKEKDMEH